VGSCYNSCPGAGGRSTLTKKQIAEQHGRCCAALFQAGFNPFLTRFFRTPDGCEKRFINRTYSHDTSPANFTFRRSRNWNSLPRPDAAQAAKMEEWLRDILKNEPGIWMGMVTRKAPPCTVDQVGQCRRELMNKFRGFMLQQARFHGVDHFFSSVHESVRARKTGILRINAEGQLLYHVNLHFFFVPPPKGKKRDRFIARLKNNFGGGSGVMEVKNPMGAIKYLTAVQDRTDLLDHDEFVHWHQQTWKTSRFRRYGERKPPSRRNRSREESNPAPIPIPAMGIENRLIGKTFLGKKSYTIWDNVTEPIAKLYDQQGVPREPDLP
jgi:hypothetical protein